ncbi:MAG: hypothetical protein HKN47_11440 [Pirellulaceae bacterium]|nr:hypothetical protein [Pirellulaceae bacterium]
MYDFPTAIIQQQLSYYGLNEVTEQMAHFLSSLGLHKVDGTPRPAWNVLEQRAKMIRTHHVPH